MSVTINAKGTSVSTFAIGKNGTTISQAGEITPPSGNDLIFNLGVNQNVIFDAGISGPSLITTTDTRDLHINPAVGGGQYLILNSVRWPVADGTTNQVLRTNGSGVLSWYTPAAAAPDYEEFVATASQTVFNTAISTTAKGSGKAYLQVFVNGVFQQEGATKQFTVTGATQITFNSGLAASDDVVIYGYA